MTPPWDKPVRHLLSRWMVLVSARQHRPPPGQRAGRLPWSKPSPPRWKKAATDTMLPRIEVENPVNAAFEALDLAADGRVADGYQVLLLGKQKALEGDANSEPTAEAVEAAWNVAIRGCARRYGVGRA